MTGLRLELANPNEYGSPAEYIERHLAPVATELHRIANELLAPGATSAEEWAVDMVPEVRNSVMWQRLDHTLHEQCKHVVFDGSEYLTIPAELLRRKQLKVQFNATVYSVPAAGRINGTSDFRLVDAYGDVIAGSAFSSTAVMPEQLVFTLPFGDHPNSIKTTKQSYLMEARSPDRSALPVCRRLSLSFVYI